jgi:uncharacterized protein YjbI with pentapeptide repeats
MSQIFLPSVEMCARPIRINGRLPAMVAFVAAAIFSILPINPAAAACRAPASPYVDWQDCEKDKLMLGASDLTGANLSGVNFTSTDLAETTLMGANLEKATLVRASLAGARADKANFAKIEAYRANFARISAQNASFASAEVERADFSEANLTGADFEKAELGRAEFKKATLTGTRFPFANLSRADFTGTAFEGPIDFQMAFLFLTRIEGVDLSAATGLQQWQIDLACGDAKTKLPSGLNAPASWPCKFTND